MQVVTGEKRHIMVSIELTEGEARAVVDGRAIEGTEFSKDAYQLMDMILKQIDRQLNPKDMPAESTRASRLTNGL